MSTSIGVTAARARSVLALECGAPTRDASSDSPAATPVMARVQRLPPVHALAAFESAARLGGFAQAAAELCITPSAVSHRIRLLEAHINQNLFERSSTGVRLSDAGQRYLLGVREAFEKLARLVPAD